MPAKTQQLQIRVTPQQKPTLKRLARAAGRTRSMPRARDRFGDLIVALRDGGQSRFALAELSDLLHATRASELSDVSRSADVGALTPFLQNYSRR